ncbi:MAG: hypothetical protein NT114_02510 [Patescibacteria group bacterium]|nr:hypothetical protein [Patescibacteria group bacterium]
MQHFQLIKPSSSPDEHTKTFVYSFSGQTPEIASEENIYIILTIWSPPQDLEQIAKHIEDVFSSTFYEESEQDSAKLRYKKSIQAVNQGLDDLNRYYQRLEARFHLEGLIAVISKDSLVLSSCGDVAAYQKGPTETTALIDKPKSQTQHNQFASLYSCSLSQKDKILLVSARFSDHIPKTVIYSLLKPEDPITFTEFADKISSLSNSHLGAVWVERTKANEKITESPILVSSPEKNDKQSFSKLEKPSLSIPMALTNTLSVVKKYTKSLFTKLSNISFLDSAKKTLKKAWNNLWIKYINPNPMAFIVIIVIFIVISISALGYFQWYNPHNQDLKKSYATFEQSIEKAKSQLASGQKTEALQSLSELSNAINELSPKDRQALDAILAQSKKPSLAQLQAAILQLEDQAAGIVRVDAVEVYSNPNTSASYSAIALLEEALYAIDKSSGSVLSVKSGVGKTITTNASLKNSLGLSSSLASNSIYALTPDAVYQIRPDGTLSKPASPATWPSATALSSYLSNIYLLSPEDNQIYRFSKTTTGFGSKTAYIKNPAPGLLSDATSASVNGNIFVSKRNGDVLLFDQGVQKEFNIVGKPSDQIDITSLAYIESPDQLILLNSAKKAFIILTLKDSGAEFQKEVIVNSTSGISSFSYNAKDKNVYFTTANSIKKFKL